jgi:F-type H+-transporting ATPase subunit a
MEEAQDSYDYWHLFTSNLFGFEVAIPLINLRPIGIPFTITRFMIVELVAAILVGWAFVWLANRIKNGELARGRGANLLEVMVIFVRDNVVRSVIPGKAGDFMLPYVWTVFFFILTCNLLGMLPLVGSPMASLWITMSLAICSMILMHAVPIAKLGLWNYIKTFWMPIDLPYGLGIPISLLVFLLEFLSTFIKGAVLGVRLFANMLVGHVVLGTIIAFAGAVSYLLPWMIKDDWNVSSIFSVTGAFSLAGSIGGAILISLLELLVAFLQAYVFALLTALYIALPLLHHADHEKEHGHDHEHGHEQQGEAHTAH